MAALRQVNDKKLCVLRMVEISRQLVVFKRICHQSKKNTHSRCLPLSVLEA